MSPGIVAVHCGAGFHNAKYYKEYNKLSKQASEKGIEVLKNGGTALEAVRDAVIVLENHHRTNCGYGSNLTMQGQVENDASIMNGKNLFYGGCGAVKRLKNPIELAYDLCKKQTVEIPLGLIPPSLLVDTGALRYARRIGLKIVSNKSLISTKSAKQYQSLVKMFRNCTDQEEQNLLLDTVGAVCMDENGDLAAACSSGGILLKQSGRVGQSALYACGTWADSLNKEDEPSVAVCTSGCGEHLVQTQLAKEIANDLKKNECPTTGLHKSIMDNFINSRYLRNVEQKLCGALALHRSGSEISLLWGHSTETMSVGYMKTDDKKPVAFISDLPVGSKVGQTVNVGGNYHYIVSGDPKR